MDVLAKCAVSSGSYRGWHAAFMSNGLLNVAAVPDIGGRIMAYDLADYPYLFVDPHLAGQLFSAQDNLGNGTMAAWKNYGGDKTWPSPQGWDGPDQWPGPPDPILDTGHYTLEELASTGSQAHIRMASPLGSSTGVQIIRQASISAASSRLLLHLTFTNHAQRHVRWSIWDVVQLRADRRLVDGTIVYNPGCSITAPLNPNSCYADGYAVMFGSVDNPQWQADRSTGLFTAPYMFEIGKVGLDSRGGWIAFADTTAGQAFTARFAIEPDGDYPDGGAAVECWTVGRGQVETLTYDEHTGPFLMEAEVLSPFRSLAPGASASFEIEWGACRCSDPVRNVTEAGCASTPLELKTQDGRLHLSGTFGVFDVGHLEMYLTGDDGRPAQAEALGPVDPLNLVRIDRTVPLPGWARGIELIVRDTAAQCRMLANARIPQ